MTREPCPGDDIRVLTATGEWVDKVAVTGVVADGTVDFPVVYVTERQWPGPPIPWPAEDVEVCHP